MAKLFRAYGVIAKKVAVHPFDKTATLDAKISVIATTIAKNLQHCTLDAQFAVVLDSGNNNRIVPFKAIVDGTIAVIELAGAGDVVIQASLDRPLPLILTAAANYGQNASLDKSIALTLTSFGRVSIKGRASNTLNTNNPLVLNASADVDHPLTGTLSSKITTLSLTAVVASGNQSGKLNSAILLTLTSATTQSDAFRSTATMPVFTGTAVLESNIPNAVTLPAFTGEAVLTGANTYISENILPALQGSATTGHSSNTELPALTNSAQIDSGNISDTATALPALTADAVLIPDANGRSETTLPALTGTSIVTTSSTAVSISSLPVVTSDAVLLAGIELTSETILPSLSGGAVLESGQFLVSVTTLPPLTSIALADNGVALSVTTHVFNTENMAATEYSNYDFLAMAMFNGVPVGISSTGVYELTGADDNGTDIDINVLSGFSDLGTEDLKRMPNAYVGYKSDGNIKFQVSIDGEPVIRTYTVSKISNISGIKRGRAKLAKGLKSRYWQVGIKNVAGSDLELDNLGLYIQSFNRKVQ